MSAAVSITGTVTAITSVPTDEGYQGIVVDTLEEGERDARSGINNDAEGYQELNLFVGEWARVHSMDYSAAIVDLQQRLDTMRSQSQDGALRVYEQ